jgi:hypothetical protein
VEYEEDDGQLYTVINTFFDAKKQYWATSKPQKESWDIPLGEPELKRRLIVGDDGVAYRVEQLLKGMKQGSITKWPWTEDEWIQEQLDDAGIAPIVSLLDQPDSIIKINGGKEATGDYLQRPVMDDGKAGALRRYRTGQAINFLISSVTSPKLSRHTWSLICSTGMEYLVSWSLIMEASSTTAYNRWSVTSWLWSIEYLLPRGILAVTARSRSRCPPSRMR